MTADVVSLPVVPVGTIDPARIKLVFACPIGDELVDIAFHRSMVTSTHLLRQRGIPCALAESGANSHVAMGRETVLWRAMREGATHILFVDSDIGWDPNLILRCLASGHEFCGAVGVKKQNGPVELCANPLPGKQNFDPSSGFLEISEMGFAFVMLQRSVVDKLCVAHPELRVNPRNDAKPDDIEYALFFDMIDKSVPPFGARLGEDLSFCRRWRALGGRIFVDADASLVHAGRREYTGKPRDVMRREAAEAANG